MSLQTIMISLGICSLFCLLIAWQIAGNKNAVRGWLGYSALSLELLAGGLAISWAAVNGSGLLAWIFVLGFIGMALAKASIVAAIGRAIERGLYPALVVSGVTLIAVYGVIYLAGSFAGVMEGSGKAAMEAQASAPVRAIDAQLSAARTKLNSLADYADASKAATQSGRAERLQKRLADEQATLSNCPDRHFTRCINPAKQRIRSLESQLSALTYHTGNRRYAGTQVLIADLEKQRADLLSGGSIPSASGTGADDKMISWLLGVSIEQARDLKWLLFVLAFDVLSLLFRLSGELVSVGISDSRQAGKQLAALVESGLPIPTAAAMLAQGQVLELSGSSPGTVQSHSAELSGQVYAHGQDTIGNEDDLYPVWLDELRNGNSKPTVRPIKSFLNNRLCVDGVPNTVTPAQMTTIAERWLSRAVQDGVIEETGAGAGKAKYRLTDKAGAA